MKKICLILLFLTFFIVGCFEKSETRCINLNNVLKDIVKIDIVELVEHPKTCYTFEKIKEIDSKYYEEFCDDFSTVVFIENKKRILPETGKGFIIYFYSGEYFVITQTMFDDYNKDEYYMYTIIDEETFNALLEKYLTSE